MDGNAEFKAKMIARHRPAFTLWCRVHELLEQLVVKERSLSSAYARALDLLFIEAFKSHGSLYPLCVLGHGEDGATIARRLLEIAFQVGYLCSEDSEREKRGELYLAYFWHNAKEVMKLNIPSDRRKWWEDHYNRHKQWLPLKSSEEPLQNWSGLTFAAMADKLNLKNTYEKDYRFLCNVAHCSARGLLLDKVNGVLQITSDVFVREILVFGTRYMLGITLYWNELFAVGDSATLTELHTEAINFDFKAEPMTRASERGAG